jgi:predicted secreted Zn-dependent protease
MAAQVAAAQHDAWNRLHDALTRIKDRLTLDEDGKRRIFHDTTVTNAQELCDLLTPLNVTNDPKLEQARRMLQDAIGDVDPKELRKEDSTRAFTLQKVTATLDQFDWSFDE